MDMNKEILELHKTIQDILERLKGIETTLNMRSNFDERIRTLEVKMGGHSIEDLTKRVQDLEHKQAELKGKSVILGVFATATVSIICSVAASLALWLLRGQ